MPFVWSPNFRRLVIIGGVPAALWTLVVVTDQGVETRMAAGRGPQASAGRGASDFPVHVNLAAVTGASSLEINDRQEVLRASMRRWNEAVGVEVFTESASGTWNAFSFLSSFLQSILPARRQLSTVSIEFSDVYAAPSIAETILWQQTFPRQVLTWGTITFNTRDYVFVDRTRDSPPEDLCETWGEETYESLDQTFLADRRAREGDASVEREAVDLQSTAMHELGHVLGLTHSATKGSLMAAVSTDSCLWRVVPEEEAARVRNRLGLNR